ncbi:hypothetical protein QBC37DRAFT_473373 [Rhypophila decipiens]|uniref:MIT domain-containing protein n=1 Tax=Rhypophila decipiens TaxID=261697 RepID=A0AAN7B7R6_9PEZI|nr:hypothetical protein QBC37DRAFT_473373 [Rhypophila decipiens]
MSSDSTHKQGNACCGEVAEFSKTKFIEQIGDPVALDRVVADLLLPTRYTNTADPVKEVEPSRTSGHSRSSSAGALSDSLRNLNRWSASTTSSRTSNLTGFTKRISSEVFGGSGNSPNRKLHKSRPSTSSISPRTTLPARARVESPPPVIPPLQSLPQISFGPSLEEEVRQSNVLDRSSPVPRPKLILRPSDELGLYWDGAPQIPEDNSGLSSQLNPAESLLPAATITPERKMPYTQNGDSRGHSRNRSANTSADTTSSRTRDRANRPPSQRTMLSKALQKANTAVQLDNAQNTEGARSAYSEACTLLQQVLLRTAAEEDRKKLEAIYNLYMGRISDLEELIASEEPRGKELPRRPQSSESDLLRAQYNDAGNHEMEEVSHKSARGGHESEQDEPTPSHSIPSYSSRRESSRGPPAITIPAADVSSETRDTGDGSLSALTNQYSLQSAFSRSRLGNGSTLQPSADAYMPPPLSPRRPLSPSHPPPPPPQQESPGRSIQADYYMSGARLAPNGNTNGHKRATSHESVSWLDPIDESAGSSASSVHSRSSSMGVRRKHIRAASGDTEAEFDAALDDAIEAAYDDGFEPDSQYGMGAYQEDSEVVVQKTLRRVELARERVRESEREALLEATERERKLRLQLQLDDEEYMKQDGFADDVFEGNSSDDEERMLEEMTNGYIIEDFSFSPQKKAAVPRESDSSGVTSRTWHSSMGSNPPTATTVLTTVSENAIPHSSGPLPPPTHALPQLPPQPTSAGSQGSNQSVRNRRLSGQNPKQLKIETTKIAPPAPATAHAALPHHPSRTSSYIVQQRQALSAGPNRTTGPLSARPSISPAPGTGDGYDNPPLPIGFLHDEVPRSGSPAVGRPSLRKNFSSSSLKSIKSRNLSVSHIDDTSDLSPGTPLSNQFGIGGSSSRLPALPSIPTPLAGTFRERSDTTGGLHLFDNDFHTPNSPGSPHPLVPDAPAPLEACPSDVMLRPFWLMRCLYQTLCHPRGGYLSNKLFVPRDVWRVKGAKLKNVEDKIANCDYLTAALQKLSKVDTYDADAVLEEMQSLEGVLEQVQAALTKKLGSAEVGVNGASSMFRDANAVEGDGSALPRSASVSTKGSSFSWRRLRSKNSSANLPGLATSYGGKGGSGGLSSSTTPVDGERKESLLPSLPMTAHPTSRPTKRDISSVGFTGPNAHYMASLARLFDAAQTIDQIARQVDDPGLRHADKTQVGLELCTRHAAEFFGFYICRFVLSDLTLLLDKFVKRGSEWVMV